jgi:hypothetical protein
VSEGISSVDNTPRASVTPGGSGLSTGRGAHPESAETPANLVAHLFAEGFPARRSFLLVDMEPVEDVEIFEDRVTIACHRQDAKQFGHRPAGAGDFSFTHRIGAVARREATQLRHFSSRQAPADRVTEILAKLFQFGAGY